MPNHVINRLTFDCPEERLKRILSEICYDDSAEVEITGIGTIDFNKIMPMPPSLDIEDGSNTTHGINLYLTSINPSVNYFGTDKMSPQEFDALAEKLNGHRHFFPHKSMLSSEEIAECTKYRSADELIRLGKIAVENLMNYGATTWYDWRTRGDTWNTKWNSYSPSYDGGNEICFQTAWSAPHPIIEKLSEMYPDVSIRHMWANEDLWQDCGSRTYLGGEMVDYDEPSSDKEQLEAAASIWGYDLKEDYGMVESASGNSYVDVDNETYELVSVCGQPGLFSNGRMNLNDIPQGLFLYHLRSGDNGEQFCTLEANVGVNHGGSIITNEPLELGEQDHIEFDKTNGILFMGEEITFGQFMEGDFETKEGVKFE